MLTFVGRPLWSLPLLVSAIMKRQPTPQPSSSIQQVLIVSAACIASVLFYGALVAVLASGVSPLSATNQIFRPNPEPHPKLRDEKLKEALRKDWSKAHQPMSYLGARSAVWGSIDGDGRRALGAYTGEPIEYFKQPLPNTGAIEHAWPLTRLPSPARSDMHHLFGVTGEARAARLNLHYGTVKFPVWSRGGSKSGPGSRVKPVFEVRKDKRGDFARAMFYVATVYDLEIPATEEHTLRKWDREDPPDQAEKTRNNRVATLQKSRNPFVDYPGLSKRISNF